MFWTSLAKLSVLNTQPTRLGQALSGFHCAYLDVQITRSSELLEHIVL